jgi:hypothetical protein
MVAVLEQFCASCWRWRQQEKAQNGALSDFRLVVLSLTMYAKRRVVVQRVVAMTHCRSVQIEGFAYKPSDIATTRRPKARSMACFARASRTTMRRLVLCRVVASDKSKRRSRYRWRYRY